MNQWAIAKVGVLLFERHGLPMEHMAFNQQHYRLGLKALGCMRLQQQLCLQPLCLTKAKHGRGDGLGLIEHFAGNCLPCVA
jgi:hypothetical protein